MVGLTNALESARRRILSLEKEICMLNSADNISSRHIDLQKSYDNKLHRLELQDKELQDLRDIVSSHSNDMRDMHYEKRRMFDKYRENKILVSELASELEHIQVDTCRLGHELQGLRSDRDSITSPYRRKAELLERKEQNRVFLAVVETRLDQHDQRGVQHEDR